EIHTLRERRRRGGDDTNQVLDLVVEVRQSEPDAVVPELLVHADVPREAGLGLQGGIGEPWKEEIVESRGAEPGAGTAVDPRPPLRDHVRERAALRPVGAVDAVVLDPEAGRHEQPVPEPERLLEQAGPGMTAGVERRAALRHAVFFAVFSADRGGRPLANVKMAEELRLPALDVEAPRKLARREWTRVRRVRKIHERRLVLIASAARVDLPPLERLGVARQRHHPGLADLPVVG